MLHVIKCLNGDKSRLNFGVIFVKKIDNLSWFKLI